MVKRVKIPKPEPYTLEQFTIREAIQVQFKLVDIITKHFNGEELLWAGDYGHRRTEEKHAGVRIYQHPEYTVKVENVFAELFDAKEATLTRGAGTGAIRDMFMGALDHGDQIIVDDSIIYTTTKVTMNKMGLDVIEVDFDDLNGLEKAINRKTKAVHVVHAPETKKYHLSDVIDTVRSTKINPLILVDDNYVAGRVTKIGVQLGADVSTFSMFKTLGKEGMGIVIGGTERGAEIVNQIRINERSSAGLTPQGPEAMDTLKSFIYVPVMSAIQKEVVDEVCDRLNRGEINEVDWAISVCSAYRCVYVKLTKPIAKKVYEAAWKYGSYARTIGVESRHEITGRISTLSVGSALGFKDFPENYFLKISVYRAGSDTIINMLRASINEAKKT